MVGAIEFLRKARAICETEDYNCKTAFEIIDYLGGMDKALSEADLVRKVMDYKITQSPTSTA